MEFQQDDIFSNNFIIFADNLYTITNKYFINVDNYIIIPGFIGIFLTFAEKMAKWIKKWLSRPSLWS